MAGCTFRGKRRLCYTEVTDFTDIQGIGRDPLYLRYDSVYSAMKMSVPVEYQHFLAVPNYETDEGVIYWYVDEWHGASPVRLVDLEGVERSHYDEVKSDTVAHWRSALGSLKGEALQVLSSAIKYVDDSYIYCSDDKVFLVAWGMRLDSNKHKTVGSSIHECDREVRKFRVTFDAGLGGALANRMDGLMSKQEGAAVLERDIPEIEVSDGFRFVGWTPSPVGHVVNADVVFTANYERVEPPVQDAPAPQPEAAPAVPVHDEEPQPPVQPEPEVEPDPEPESEYFSCFFDASQHGSISSGAQRISCRSGYVIDANDVPEVQPHKGYKFRGWKPSPVGCVVDGDITFHAEYEEALPWYKRLWNWLKGIFSFGKGCLKWLLWLLLFLLLCWLLSLLFRSCAGHSYDEVNGVVPIDSISSPDGRVRDDNGVEHPVTGDDGELPDDDFGVSPIHGDDGQLPPIVKKPGKPDVIGNRLILFMEDEDGDIESLARDFKKVYADSRYSIVGYDRQVKSLVIQIPEAEREEIRNSINEKLPDYKFLVFDEQIYEHNGGRSKSPTGSAGWHLKAIHLKEAWNYTKGSADVRVAIVDDGIQANHPMFKGRIVDAYNVFTQDNHLSLGTGHGTHVAGLAAGSDEFYAKGASGVAPECLIIPVQVFDNGLCSLSAWISGIMYAIHHGADVVNMSLGPHLPDLSNLTEEEQRQIADSEFQNQEILWNRVCKLSEEKNCILVFAAGNDHILSVIPPENRNKMAITVSAVDAKLRATDFTNYGSGSDLSAPGQDIYSSYPTNTLEMLDGTSMAAPIITGVVALMRSINKDITIAQARDAIYSTGAAVKGQIPPMVLADEALKAAKEGRFERKEKSGTESPDATDGFDRDAILRQIEEYKKNIAECEKKIEELEKLLK